MLHARKEKEGKRQVQSLWIRLHEDNSRIPAAAMQPDRFLRAASLDNVPANPKQPNKLEQRGSGQAEDHALHRGCPRGHIKENVGRDLGSDDTV